MSEIYTVVSIIFTTVLECVDSLLLKFTLMYSYHMSLLFFICHKSTFAGGAPQSCHWFQRVTLHLNIQDNLPVVVFVTKAVIYLVLPFNMYMQMV